MVFQATDSTQRSGIVCVLLPTAVAGLQRAWREIRVRGLARGVGSVANFAQEVVKGQWPLSAGGLGGQGVEQFGRGKVLVSFLNHQLSFPDHVHEFYTY